MTAALGLLLSLAMILGVRTVIGETAFADWGWRVPFVLSAGLLAVSVWIRLKLHESPIFEKMKTEGKRSKAPLTEAFGTWKNLRLVLIALFGITAGEAVVWYTGQFYTLFFLTQTLKLDGPLANMLLVAGIVITTPLYLAFGKLADRIGRKPILLTGFLLAILTFFPLFQALTGYVNPDLQAAQQRSPIVVSADPAQCSFQFNPVGTARFTSSCDIAKSALSKAGYSYSNVDAAPGQAAQIRIGDQTIEAYDGLAPDAKALQAAFEANLAKQLTQAGYPSKPDPAKVNKTMTMVILIILMTYGTMVYAPLAAILVELFPTRIRYTSMSLPYNIGNGWFGGFLPASVFAIVAAQGNMYAGLWYPVAIAAVSLVVGLLFLTETNGTDLSDKG
jgi:MFS family permease